MTAASLYRTRVSHRRPGSPRYRFVYQSFYLRLDLDRLDEIAASTRLLSRNRFNILSFFDRDHGPHDGSSLRAFIDSRLAEQSIEIGNGRVELLAMPRVFGYVFHPVSFYYCYRSDDELAAVVVEVHNTFGEHHFYVLGDGGRALAEPVTHDKSKQFHVSPFLDRAGHYAFCLQRPGKRLAIGIRLFQDGELTIATALSGQNYRLCSATILKTALGVPLMPFKVTAAIYWQALKLWWRGATYRSKPAPSGDNIS